MISRRWVAAIIVLVSLEGCDSRDSKRPGSATNSAALHGEVGQPAPPYQTVTLSGNPVALTDFRGKVVLLNVWATWCGPCRGEIPELRIIDSTYKGRGLRVIGVTIDADGSQPRVRDFVKEFRMGYAIWHDPNERVSAQFRIIGVPSTFLIDRAGMVRWRSTGPIAPGDTSLRAAITRALE